MLPALIALIPLAGTLLPPALARHGRNACAIAAAAPTAMALAALLYCLPAVFAGQVVEFRAAWIPQLGLSLSFLVDGLSAFFAALILGMGLLVTLYARYYMPATDAMGRFYGYLLLFQGSMLGIVLSDNVLALLVFWELTSLSSFLLIGYWYTRPDSRQGARMALVVTGGGGLALLAGLLVLGGIAGSYELSEIIERRDAVRASPLFSVALVLVLVGAFTKSAQFPFHFWLPHAMAAPTPVSAYLHSATMVKAGIFLLARLWPVFAGTTPWLLLLGGIGIATMLIAAWIALFRNDLKLLLAYSTVSHLGMIVMLLGFGTPAAAVAAVFHILNHALFKASLFMNAGIVDHEAGTRDMTRLGGLARVMPVTAALASIAAAAMAGVPLLNGFLSKEMMLEQAAGTVYGGVAWLMPVLATLGALLSTAYSVRLVRSVYFGPTRHAAAQAPHDPPLGMSLPVAILVVPIILVGVFPALAAPTVERAASAVVGTPLAPLELALWHGLTPALGMSVAALLGGLALALSLPTASRLLASLPHPDAKRLYERAVDTGVAAARWCIERSHSGELPRYVACIVVAVLAMAATGFLGGSHEAGTRPPLAANSAALVGWLVLAAACIVVLLAHHDRLLLLVLTSAVGLVVSLTFALFSAPDLALTQISVEVVAVVLLLLALNLMPKTTPRETSTVKRCFDGLVAGVAGLAAAGGAFAVLTRGFDPISAYHLAESKPAAAGSNVVNVILVDFRAFDTFGEIIVLGIAAIAIVALLDPALRDAAARRASRPIANNPEPPSALLVVGTRLLLPLVLTAALYLLLRGHNLPGGGFIAGVVVAVAFLMQYVASGHDWTAGRARLDAHALIGGGILVAGLVGMGSWLTGSAFLTSAHGHIELPLLGPVEWSSVLLFDLGVFATVVGTVLLALATLSRVKGRVAETLSLAPDVKAQRPGPAGGEAAAPGAERVLRRERA